MTASLCTGTPWSPNNRVDCSLIWQNPLGFFSFPGRSLEWFLGWVGLQEARRVGPPWGCTHVLALAGLESMFSCPLDHGHVQPSSMDSGGKVSPQRLRNLQLAPVFMSAPLRKTAPALLPVQQQMRQIPDPPPQMCRLLPWFSQIKNRSHPTHQLLPVPRVPKPEVLLIYTTHVVPM